MDDMDKLSAQGFEVLRSSSRRSRERWVGIELFLSMLELTVTPC